MVTRDVASIIDHVENAGVTGKFPSAMIVDFAIFCHFFVKKSPFPRFIFDLSRTRVA